MYFLTDFTVPGGLSLSVPKYDATTSWGTNTYVSTALSLPNGQQFFPYGNGDVPADGVRRVIYPCVIVATSSDYAQVEAEKWLSLSGRVGILRRFPVSATFTRNVQECTACLVEAIVPTGTTKQQPFLYITLVFEIQGVWRGLPHNEVFGGTPTLLAPNYGTRIANPIVYVTINGASGATRADIYNDTAGVNAALRVTFTPTAGLDSLVVNTQTLEVTYNGVNIWTGLSFLTNHKRIEWYPILPGANALRIYVPSSGLNGWTVRYHDSYY